jgi:hypothetical protein
MTNDETLISVSNSDLATQIANDPELDPPLRHLLLSDLAWAGEQGLKPPRTIIEWGRQALLGLLTNS